MNRQKSSIMSIIYVKIDLPAAFFDESDSKLDTPSSQEYDQKANDKGNG